MSYQTKKIYVAGSNGMVGRAIVRKLEDKGYENLILRASDELNLQNQSDVEVFFAEEKPDIVILAAAKVGGILANDKFRAEFIYNNLMIEANVINASFKKNVEKLIFLGSSCVYPKHAPQPIKEEYLLTGPLEPSNEPYAIAKIAGIKLCENYFRQYGSDFFSVMPTNLYGSFDNFDLETSHVIPALIRRFHEAKVLGSEEVVLWGSGTPRREFLFVDDLADAVVFLMEGLSAINLFDERGISHINIGTGQDLEIRELAEMIAGITGFGRNIKFDTSMTDGTPRKLLDVSRMSDLGWTYSTDLEDGLIKTYDWFLKNGSAQI